MGIHIKLVIMSFLYAGGFVAGKVAMAEAGPFTIAFIRFFIASIILTVVVNRQEETTQLNPRDYVIGAIGAFFGVFCYNYLFLSGIQYVDTSRAAIIVSMIPIVVAVLSMWMFDEPGGRAKITGIIVSMSGAWIVLSGGKLSQILVQPLGKGEMLLLGCVLCAACFTFLSRHLLRTLTPLRTITIISTLGALSLAGPALSEIRSGMMDSVSVHFLWSIFYLGIGPSVIGVTFYYQALRLIGPSRATQYMNLMPVFAVCLGVIFLDEQINRTLMLGGSLVVAGLYLTNMNKNPMERR